MCIYYYTYSFIERVTKRINIGKAQKFQRNGFPQFSKGEIGLDYV